MKERKLVKAQNGYLQDSNFDNVRMTKSQALKHFKKYKKQLENSYKNGFKFKSLTLIEKDNHFTMSLI